MSGLFPFQQKFAQPSDRVDRWRPAEGKPIDLLDVIKNAHPAILIGVSGQAGVFDEETVRTMAGQVDRPIIFPLSNPTSRAEAVPADLLAWTDGRALIATGSPFDDVSHEGRNYSIAQCNNSYIFPGLGLGVCAVEARRVTNAMFMAAARALADGSPARRDPAGALLPPLSESRQVSRSIALAVATRAVQDGLAGQHLAEELEQLVDAKMWLPRYLPMKRKR
jgi:malate dehydrogenase (oxaloacetate-decarboxylating)